MSQKIRPSPSQSATLYNVGSKKTGNDGNIWIVTENVNGVKRWKLFKKPIRNGSKKESNKTKGSVKKYYTHNNGGRPYMVQIQDGIISIYENEPTYDEKVKTIKSYDKIFIGKDNTMVKGNKDDPRFLGNSILIKLSRHIYIYVGNEIYKFRTKDEIVDYKSYVGNSDVPYPYAIGTEYTYLMIEDICIPNEVLDEYDANVDPYEIYYGTLKNKKINLHEEEMDII